MEDGIQLPFGLLTVPSDAVWITWGPSGLHATDKLHESLYKGVLIYLGDILIYTEMMEEYIKLVRVVLEKLRAALCKTVQV